MTEEARARRQIYNALMQVPHRDYSPLVTALREAMQEDPDFTARACVHICAESKIRDQQDAAVITLLQSPPIYDYRESGRCLLLGSDVYQIEPDGVPSFPPFRIFRVERFMRSPVRILDINDSLVEVGRFASQTEAEKAIPKIAARLEKEPENFSVSVDDKHISSPRLMKNIMVDYIETLESDPTRFDGVVMRNRKALKSVYVHYHIKPSERAQAILFDNSPPEDSKLAVLKEIANCDNPREQAKLVIKHKIPYVVATSVLPKVSPVVGIALIEAMSPTEALNSRAWVERSGLLNIPEVKETYVAKIAGAQKSIASAEYRKSAKGQDADVEAAKVQAKENAVAKETRIEGQVDILLDVSYSMMEAIRVAPKFAERIFPLCDDKELFIHNDYARRVRIQDTGNPLADIQRALRGVRAGGGTLHHTAFEASRQLGREPDKIVLLTDGGCNRYGEPFVRAIQRYESETGKVPTLVMIHFDGDRDVLTPALQQAGYPIEKLHFTGDYYLFDQATALLGGPPAMGIIERIMQTELPRRANK